MDILLSSSNKGETNIFLRLWFIFVCMKINLARDTRIQTRLLFLLCMGLGVLSLMAPVWPGGDVASHIGALTIWVGLIEIYHGFRRNKRWSRRNAMYSGAFSIIVGIILINSRLIKSESLQLIIAVIFCVEAIRYLRNHIRQIPLAHKRITFDLLAAIGNVILVLGIFFFPGKGALWLMAWIMALRHAGIGISLLAAPVGVLDQVSEDIVGEMGIDQYKALPALAQSIEDEEALRAPYDRKWVVLFIILLFFIHLGRMGLDRSFIGILSPLVATVGDMAIALIISYGIIWPFRMGFKKISGWLDGLLWGWVLAEQKRVGWQHWLSVAVRRLLTGRMRTAIQFRKAGYSFRTALRTGLRMGLPWSALLAAIMPVLGMSWYFDTENWASGIWDRWAAVRTDSWRVAMINASGQQLNNPLAFNVWTPGMSDTSDFSFVVVGDPGEGDASQLVLKDQIIKVTNQPDVKFLIISSDVVYPSGALKDYEKKFWMPFKGVEKPVLAIPGNHDWYDALDGFTASFFEPHSAKKALLARIQADLALSSTTEKKIDEMIAQCETWRQEYNVPTGFQNAPFFQVSTKDFVLITLETGIERRIDTLQMQWLKTVLDASENKYVMVLLGHPFYAIGEYQGAMNPDFEALHTLLKKYKVKLVMAGDTHDFEYYREPLRPDSTYVMHHFVNGGGGAYLSIGTALARPEHMPLNDYAFYPSKEPLVQKIERLTSWYKYPAWWYTKKFDGWPFSAEWLSAAFDYNEAPFFQSFVEVKVEPSRNRIRLIPYTNKGRMRRSELAATGNIPLNNTGDFVEWIFPLNSSDSN